MLKIGITGQAGFIGTHLYNTLGLFRERFVRIVFEYSFFESDHELDKFVQSCDTIVHLAGMNRHHDPSVIYETNISLVRKLIDACERTISKPHIIFSSSTQEERENEYGKSKREGRILFELWAERNDAFFTGLIIPNVFGPFGQPFYNSVIATFCHQLAHNEQPKVDIDNEIKLIYVTGLISKIIDVAEKKQVPNNSELHSETIRIEPNYCIKVSELLHILLEMKNSYFNAGILPDLKDAFKRDIFNTLLTYVDHRTFFPFKLKQNIDNRGKFVEIIRLNSGGQVSFSTTLPGITRGNHFHTRKAERFAVLNGKAKIELRKIGSSEKISFLLDGNESSFVDMPVWYTHNITNVGDEDLYTVFWISEHFNPDDPDTFFEEV